MVNTMLIRAYFCAQVVTSATIFPTAPTELNAETGACDGAGDSDARSIRFERNGGELRCLPPSSPSVEATAAMCLTASGECGGLSDDARVRYS